MCRALFFYKEIQMCVFIIVLCVKFHVSMKQQTAVCMSFRLSANVQKGLMQAKITGFGAHMESFLSMCYSPDAF